MENIKIKAYKNACLAYGFITLLFLIDEYEKNEYFEECAIIKQALQEMNSEFNLNIPFIYNKEAIQKFRREMYKITGTNGDIALDNLKFYAMCVEKDVKRELKRSITLSQQSLNDSLNNYSKI